MGAHTNTRWERDFIWRRSLFDNEIDMADSFLRDVEGNPIQSLRRDDWIWKADPSGQYSIEENHDGAFKEL